MLKVNLSLQNQVMWFSVHQIQTFFFAGSLHITVKPHSAEEDDEISIDEGDLVTVIQTSEDGWWFVRYLYAWPQ